jgi:uncharacterized RmlC-like cupin family protein
MTTTCHKLRPSADHVYDGKQGFSYFEGISRESVGATGICMHLLTIPPGGRAKAHLHEAHETSIYMLEGISEMYWGHGLEHHMRLEAGDILYIPAGMPHLPYNPGHIPARAVIARTDPHEQESVVLRPDLEK